MKEFNVDLFKKLAKEVFEIDSPTGYTDNCIDYIKTYVDKLGFKNKKMNNGALEVFVEGEDHSKLVATSAHVDTLGLMVRSIKDNGHLAFTEIGGILTPTLDGEYCNIITRDGKKYTGTILSTSPAVHVYLDARDKKRDPDNMDVRIDEKVFNKQDVLNLGINNGDIIAYSTNYEFTSNGFLKTRFIDDKACAVILMMLLKDIKDNKVSLKYDTKLYFTVYEEIGHGATCVDQKIDEFVTLDMGCVGLDLAGNEYSVSICAKDNAGPYDYELTTRLINLAKENKLDYVVDIYPRYSSDVSAASRASTDFKGALIGPGVNASHGMERTHIEGIINTYKLIYLYLVK